MKKSRKFIVSLISGVCASVFMIASASADYSPAAKALGFNLEKTVIKTLAWLLNTPQKHMLQTKVQLNVSVEQ